MLKFEKTIFLGNGDSSRAQCYDLHLRLQEGLMILGVLQQPDHSTSKKEEKRNKMERKRLEMELQQIAVDICIAFGQEHVLF